MDPSLQKVYDLTLTVEHFLSGIRKEVCNEDSPDNKISIRYKIERAVSYLKEMDDILGG